MFMSFGDVRRVKQFPAPGTPSRTGHIHPDITVTAVIAGLRIYFRPMSTSVATLETQTHSVAVAAVRWDALDVLRGLTIILKL